MFDFQGYFLFLVSFMIFFGNFVYLLDFLLLACLVDEKMEEIKISLEI